VRGEHPEVTTTHPRRRTVAANRTNEDRTSHMLDTFLITPPDTTVPADTT
jgi:hypothetical protein